MLMLQKTTYYPKCPNHRKKLPSGPQSVMDQLSRVSVNPGHDEKGSLKMEWLTIIALTCMGSSNPSCQAEQKECVEWVYKQPEVRAKDLSKDTIAMWLNQYPKKQKTLCR
jgi:hypothetical protein